MYTSFLWGNFVNSILTLIVITCTKKKEFQLSPNKVLHTNILCTSCWEFLLGIYDITFTTVWTSLIYRCRVVHVIKAFFSWHLQHVRYVAQKQLFDQRHIRNHLYTCLQKGELPMFPIANERNPKITESTYYTIPCLFVATECQKTTWTAWFSVVDVSNGTMHSMLVYLKQH